MCTPPATSVDHWHFYLRFPLAAAGLAAAAGFFALDEEGPASEEGLPVAFLASAALRIRLSSSLSWITSSVAVGRFSCSKHGPRAWCQEIRGRCEGDIEREVHGEMKRKDAVGY